MTAVPEQVRQLLAETLDVSPDEVTLTSRVAEDLGADSLDLCDLIVRFEKTFHVELTDDDEASFDQATVADVVALLKARGAEV